MAGRAARIAVSPSRSGAILARLILDTSVLVSAERGLAPFSSLADDEDEVAISALTAAELLLGVELADRRNKPRRRRRVEAILNSIPLEDYDLEVARAHAKLMAHTRGSGRPRGAHDLIIAATALARSRIVVTADRSGFEELPGVEIRSWGAR